MQGWKAYGLVMPVVGNLSWESKSAYNPVYTKRMQSIEQVIVLQKTHKEILLIKMSVSGNVTTAIKALYCTISKFLSRCLWKCLPFQISIAILTNNSLETLQKVFPKGNYFCSRDKTSAPFCCKCQYLLLLEAVFTESLSLGKTSEIKYNL